MGCENVKSASGSATEVGKDHLECVNPEGWSRGFQEPGVCEEGCHRLRESLWERKGSVVGNAAREVWGALECQVLRLGD